MAQPKQQRAESLEGDPAAVVTISVRPNENGGYTVDIAPWEVKVDLEAAGSEIVWKATGVESFRIGFKNPRHFANDTPQGRDEARSGPVRGTPALGQRYNYTIELDVAEQTGRRTLTIDPDYIFVRPGGGNY